MRVIQLGPWPPPFGGVQTHIVALRRRMEQRGIASEVVNTTSAMPSGDVGVYYPRSAAALLAILYHRRPDVLHLHIGGNLSPRLIGLAAVCVHFPGSRSVLTFHSGGFPSQPAAQALTKRTLTAAIFRGFDHIVVVNDQQRELFLRLGCDPVRLHMILPYPAPDPTQVERAALDPSLLAFLASHTPTVVSVGLLEPEYDMQFLIDRVGALRAAFGDAGLVIVGSGSLYHDLALAADLSPVAQHIRVTGDLPHDATLRVIRDAHVLARNTRYDGDAISIREALALGTPVVATNTGMRPDGCQLFEVGSVSGFLAAVAAALTSTGARTSLDVTDQLDRVVALYKASK